MQKSTFDPAAIEHVLAGVRELRRAFLETPLRIVPRGEQVLSLENSQGGAFLIRSGVGYRTYTLHDGRRAILDLVIPGDIVGLDTLFIRQPNQMITAADAIGGHTMSTTRMRQFLANEVPSNAITALILEARARIDRHSVMLARLNASERIAAMLLGFYDRLRSRHFIQRASFNLPLTQEEIADYLGLTTEHVNRVLRHMREQNLLIMDRGVVLLRDVAGIRKIVGHNFGRKPDEPRLVSDLEVSDRI